MHSFWFGRIIMEEITIYYLLVVLGIFASSCSQVLLKKSATQEHGSMLSSIFNKKVIIAYTIFGMSILINVTAMGKGVNLKDLPILESLGYVFVPIISFVFLKEEITKQTITSIFLILLGVFLFYM